MNWVINQLAKIRLLKGDFDYHLVRASMVIIYFFFGYQKWFDYEAKELLPFFTHGPLIFWMYAVFGIKGSTYLLGVSEWLFGALPDGWAKSAGGFPAMVGNVGFLMKDLVLLAVSVYLLKQDLIRAALDEGSARHESSLAFASFGEQTTLQAERTMK